MFIHGLACVVAGPAVVEGLVDLALVVLLDSLGVGVHTREDSGRLVVALVLLVIVLVLGSGLLLDQRFVLRALGDVVVQEQLVDCVLPSVGLEDGLIEGLAREIVV